jgi:uncharacterized protein
VRALRYPFTLTPDGRMSEARSYEDLVRGQVIDALMTNQGERVMRPRYGCDVQAALFDPTDELVIKDAASRLKQALESLVTRAIVRSVNVTTGDPGVVYIDVVYRPSLYATDVNLTVPVSSEYLRRQIQRGAETI